MEMTHYMELLATNQPWNLILFMAIPVILAETVAITELMILLKKKQDGALGMVNKIAGILGGWYFLGVFVYLFLTAFLPITSAGGWRSWVDFIAVSAYLLGVIPLMGIALLDMNIIARNKPQAKRQELHVCFVALFLVVAHIAMVFGMVDPSIAGYVSSPSMDMSHMDMMNMNH